MTTQSVASSATTHPVAPRTTPSTTDHTPTRRTWIALPLTLTLAAAWAACFSYLAVVRHLAGGTHAEDLGFTDQVLWNFLHGQWFRMSIYNGATWNTELDLSRVARPDSLLAFHVEPMLLLLVPAYAAGGTLVLLVLQSVAVAAGALPAFRLGRHLTSSPVCGGCVGAIYLLSPFGQWAVLADFHTSTLAAPLLLFSLERLVVARAPVQALLVATLAASAREDVGPVLALLGLTLLWRSSPHGRRVGGAYVLLGVGSTVLSLLVLRHYSGSVSPFAVRYGSDPASILDLLGRPSVLGYARTFLLSGGWLGLFAPIALLPAVPSLALNALSSSDWMAAGKAHYSGLVLPFVAVGAAAGLATLGGHARAQRVAAAALVVTSLLGYVMQGSGPLAGNYAPAALSAHADRAAALASGLPADAAISASTALVPRVSARAHVYVFPTVLDADYVFLDLQSTPAPTSAGDVYLRVQSLLGSSEWRVLTAEDGLLLLQHTPGSEPTPESATPTDRNPAQPRLLGATLVPSPDAALGVDGPHWILHTVWTLDQPLPSNTHMDFWVDLSSGERVHLWDIADLWWNPPDRWPIGQPVSVDVPDIPVRDFVSWSATWRTD